MRSVRVKGRPEAYALHPWIFRSSFLGPEVEAGEAVVVHTARGKRVGSAFYAPTSFIALRLYSHQEEPFTFLTLKARLEQALALRERLYPGSRTYRLVFSESDGLPGLIVDRYGEGVVIQINAWAFEVRRQDVVDALVDLLDPAFIYEDSESAARKKEGLAPHQEVHHGTLPGVHTFELNGFTWTIDFREGQKTGFFLDQRENYREIERLSDGRRILDVFSYTGGFTLHALRGGAREVYAVDISQTALEHLRENVARHVENAPVLTFPGNAFEVLDQFLLTRERFDGIILDPPAFAKEKKAVPRAMVGYDRLHEKAMRLLAPGGWLATFSCAYQIKEEHLLQSLERAAIRAGRRFRILKRLSQAGDHPVLLGFPESHYLKGLILEVLET